MTPPGHDKRLAWPPRDCRGTRTCDTLHHQQQQRHPARRFLTQRFFSSRSVTADTSTNTGTNCTSSTWTWTRIRQLLTTSPVWRIVRVVNTPRGEASTELLELDVTQVNLPTELAATLWNATLVTLSVRRHVSRVTRHESRVAVTLVTARHLAAAGSRNMNTVHDRNILAVIISSYFDS